MLQFFQFGTNFFTSVYVYIMYYMNQVYGRILYSCIELFYIIWIIFNEKNNNDRNKIIVSITEVME